MTVVGIIQKASSYLLFHFSDEFERLQGKEADCHLLLKTDFHQKNLQIEKIVMNTINYHKVTRTHDFLHLFLLVCDIIKHSVVVIAVNIF